MKTYKTTVYPSQHKLFELLTHNVNDRFSDKVKSDLKLEIELTGDGINIGQPDMYEGYLYKINVSVNEIRVSKSEHYVDDINSLALEDIIDNIITEFIGTDNIETILQP